MFYHLGWLLYSNIQHYTTHLWRYWEGCEIIGLTWAYNIVPGRDGNAWTFETCWNQKQRTGVKGLRKERATEQRSPVLVIVPRKRNKFARANLRQGSEGCPRWKADHSRSLFAAFRVLWEPIPINWHCELQLGKNKGHSRHHRFSLDASSRVLPTHRCLGSQRPRWPSKT